MKALTLLLFPAAALLLAACASDPAHNATYGSLRDAPFAAETPRMAAVAPGTLGGAFVGGETGKGLDQVDRLKLQQAIDLAATAPVGRTVSWSNPDSGHSGSVTTIRDGILSGGLYCREYRQSVTLGGATSEAVGTACQFPDGSWKPVSG